MYVHLALARLAHERERLGPLAGVRGARRPPIVNDKFELLLLFKGVVQLNLLLEFGVQVVLHDISAAELLPQPGGPFDLDLQARGNASAHEGSDQSVSRALSFSPRALSPSLSLPPRALSPFLSLPPSFPLSFPLSLAYYAAWVALRKGVLVRESPARHGARSEYTVLSHGRSRRVAPWLACLHCGPVHTPETSLSTSVDARMFITWHPTRTATQALSPGAWTTMQGTGCPCTHPPRIHCAACDGQESAGLSLARDRQLDARLGHHVHHGTADDKQTTSRPWKNGVSSFHTARGPADFGGFLIKF